MATDHYPGHVRKVEELIASGEAGRKVARQLAEDRKVRTATNTLSTVHCTLYNVNTMYTLRIIHVHVHIQ